MSYTIYGHMPKEDDKNAQKPLVVKKPVGAEGAQVEVPENEAEEFNRKEQKEGQ